MAQINPSLYLKPYGSVDRSDGWYVERSTGDLVAFVDGSEVSRVTAAGSEAITLAEGNVLVGNASNVGAALDASGDGYIMVGDGTTVASVAVSGDVALTKTGATTVTDLTIASEARGCLLRRNASAWGVVSAKTAGQVVMGDGTDVVAQALTGDVSAIASNGKVSLADNFRLRTITTDSTADVTTYTLVKIQGGILLRDPSGASRTDTTDTASALVAGFNTPAAVGQYFDVVVVNTADADETITLAAGAGVTLSPTTIEIGRGQAARLLFVATNVTPAAEAVTCYLIDNRLASGQMLIGDANGMPIPRTLSGDVTVGATGTTAIGTNKVTPSMLAAALPTYVDTTITNAEFVTLRASPKTIVAAPGTGKAIIVHKVFIAVEASTAAYTESADNIAVEYSGGQDILTIETTGLIDSAACDYRIQDADYATAYKPVAEQAVQMFNSGDGEFGGGDVANVIYVRTYYSVVDIPAELGGA